MKKVLFSTTDAYYDLMYFCWLSSSKVVNATWSVNCLLLTVIGVVIFCWTWNKPIIRYTELLQYEPQMAEASEKWAGQRKIAGEKSRGAAGR